MKDEFVDGEMEDINIAKQNSDEDVSGRVMMAVRCDEYGRSEVKK